MLGEKCQTITKFDNELRILIDDMFETMVKANGDGLAAPQVGIPVRLFVVNSRNGEKRAYVNPQILETSIETDTEEEGCLSLPGVWHKVERSARVTVQAQDLEGKFFTVIAEGLHARALQHEYDHLNGTLFIDRLSDEEREKVVRSYEKKARIRRRAKP